SLGDATSPHYHQATDTASESSPAISPFPRALHLAKLPNVTWIQGWQDSQDDLHRYRAFHGVYDAWINIASLALGEKNKLLFGIRAYEIAWYAALY
ncbi:hypothetical protein BDP27DRAFT_304260, partial [Rhodocollybia butyracea]